MLVANQMYAELLAKRAGEARATKVVQQALEAEQKKVGHLGRQHRSAQLCVRAVRTFPRCEFELCALQLCSAVAWGEDSLRCCEDPMDSSRLQRAWQPYCRANATHGPCRLCVTFSEGQASSMAVSPILEFWQCGPEVLRGNMQVV